MASEITTQDKMEDHALEQVPLEERQNWLKLSWNTAGIVTTLIQLFFGALLTFVAGLKIALICGVIVTLTGGTLGALVGHLAYKTGLSSTVMARYFGFGIKGSVVASFIFAFMIIGFLALENALLYKGFLFAFNLEDNLNNAIIIYGTLTFVWVFLTAYGFELITKISSFTLVAFVILLVYITYTVVSQYAIDVNFLDIPPLLPPEVLQSMNASTDTGKYIFGINLLIGSAGALALVDADMGRYAKSTKDIAIAAYLGNAAMSILMLFLGGIMMYAGNQVLVDFYVQGGMDVQAAHQRALSPDGVTAAFIFFGGFSGTILMILAQGKAQVLNTYSASLSLSNLFDALGSWKPGRLTFVISANIIALMMLYGNILSYVNSWITILGVLTTTLAGIMISDYFYIKKCKFDEDDIKNVKQFNLAGIITTIVASVSAHFYLVEISPIEFLSSLVISLVLYPILYRVFN